MRTDCVIHLSDLPYRATKLNVADMQQVFGGCKGLGQFCSGIKDCSAPGIRPEA